MFYILGVFVVILFALANINYTKRQTDLSKDKLSGEKLFIIAGSLLLFMIFALQSEYSNGDLLGYATAYQHLSGYSFEYFMSRIGNMRDPVYYLCGSMFAKLGFGFRAWRLLIGAVYTLAVYVLISRYSSNVYISFIVLITIGSLSFTLSGLRQTLALSFLMLSFGFLENKKIVKFICMVLIAALFHSTAIIFLLAYPLYHLKLRLRNLVILGLGSIVVILNSRLFLVGFINFIGTEDVYNSYLEKESSLTISGVIIFGFILIFCWVSYYMGVNDAKYQGLCNIAVISLMFRILSVTMFAEMFRISMYFTAFDILLIAEACSCGEKKASVQRIKTAGATLAMAAYYFVSPSSAFVKYIFK